jgi:hypothetical protein
MRELLCENDDFMQKIDFVRVLPLVVLANTRNSVSLAVEAIIKNEGDHRVRSCELSADPGDSDAGGVHRDDHRGSFDLEFVAPPTQRMVAPYTCLALLVGVPFMIPPVLTIDVHGIVSRTWFGHQKIIRWGM